MQKEYKRKGMKAALDGLSDDQKDEKRQDLERKKEAWGSLSEDLRVEKQRCLEEETKGNSLILHIQAKFKKTRSI